MRVCFKTGLLLGIAVRTGSPLNLSLAEPVWKQLAGMTLNVTDLNEIDKDYVPGMLCDLAFKKSDYPYLLKDVTVSDFRLPAPSLGIL